MCAFERGGEGGGGGGGGIFIERVGGEREEGRGSGEKTASESVYEIAKYHK